MRRLALSAQLLAGRNRQLGIAPWAALVHRLSLALDSGLAHTAADRYGYRLDAGQDRSCAYLGVRRLDSSGTWGGGSAEMLAMPSICQGCCRSWPYLSVCAAGRDLPGPRIAGCWDGRIGV